MVGTRLSHYEVVRLLGRGGMGEVYEAVDLDLDRRPVALKFIAPEMAADPEHLKRFEREAISAAKLRHANIATVHAFVREGGRPFIDMELVTGGSLRDRMRGRPLPVPEALAIARDVAAALAHAHARGIVHRDIKPENLMFGEEGEVKVMDFGLARAAQASRLTMTGTTMGTAGYMSPEAVRGNAGAPADVFALGVVLYEMLTLELPFAGDSPLQLMYTIANEPPRPLRPLRPETPDAVVSLVDRLLEKDAARRPDAAAAARELAALTGVAPPRLEPVTEVHEAVPVEGAPTAAMPALATMPMPAAGAGLPAPRAEALPARRMRRRAAPLLAGLLALAVAGAAVVVLVALPARQRAEAARESEAKALNNRGQQALVAGDLPAARAAFEQAIERSPGYTEARINLGHLLGLLGRADSAATLLGAAVSATADRPALRALALHNLASLDLDAGAWAGAAERERQAVALDTTIVEYAGNLVFALVRAGRYPEAIAAGEAALRRFPGHPGLAKNLGYALVMADRAADALPFLDRAVAASENPGPSHGVRALAHAALGHAALAADDWSAFLESAPSPAERETMAREFGARGGRR